MHISMTGLMINYTVLINYIMMFRTWPFSNGGGIKGKDDTVFGVLPAPNALGLPQYLQAVA